MTMGWSEMESKWNKKGANSVISSQKKMRGVPRVFHEKKREKTS